MSPTGDLSPGQIRELLSPLRPEVLSKVAEALRTPRVFEAERILCEQLGSGLLAKRIVASMIKREVQRG